jgi:hypothetical protein
MSPERSGRVVKRTYAPGSKSEREAVMLVTDEGEYLLRRQGGNPFSDPELEDLVGRRVRAEGVLHASSFIISRWQVIDSG